MSGTLYWMRELDERLGVQHSATGEAWGHSDILKLLLFFNCSFGLVGVGWLGLQTGWRSGRNIPGAHTVHLHSAFHFYLIAHTVRLLTFMSALYFCYTVTIRSFLHTYCSHWSPNCTQDTSTCTPPPQTNMQTNNYYKSLW